MRFVASFAYIGYAPFAPGTLGSAAGMALAWFFPQALVAMALTFSLSGLAICRLSQAAFNHADPSAFVLDEVAGMMLSVLWLPHDIIWYVLAFLLFRVLDVSKPGPIGMMQRSASPYSIMGDDLLAGVFAGGGLWLVAALF